jgi:hypothetical protein
MERASRRFWRPLFFTAVAVGVIAVVLTFTRVWAESGKAGRPPGEVGRYQGAGGDQNEVWLIDTTTGECWRAHTRGDARQWEQLVPPLPANPERAKSDKL